MTYTLAHKNRKDQLNKDFLSSVTTDYTNHINKRSQQLKKEPRLFWSFIKSKTKNSQPKSFITDSGIKTNDEEIAQVFATYFNSVYEIRSVQNPLNNIQNEFSPPCHININSISKNDIIDAIKKIPNKGPGPDQIPAKIVKAGMYLLVPNLHYLFNLSIENKTFPTLLKQSFITPIFKKGNPQLTTNYRPITSINTFAKIFESIVYKKISSELMHNITPEQHGFIKRRSIDTNLLLLQNDITETFNKNRQLDVIYTDLEKFFDKIQTQTLLGSMKIFGFSENMIKFFYTYLTNRENIVKYGNSISKPFFPSSGIPQGSKLSSLFAIVIMNRIKSQLKYSKFLIFADDLKIYKTITNKGDCELLQKDINSVQQWACNNGLSFNIKKCEIMTFTRSKTKIKFKYRIAGQELQEVTQKKDLGIIFQSNGEFNSHINSIINACYKRIGLIKRNCIHMKDIDTIILLYSSLIRSKLEFGAVVWNPTTKLQIKNLERVQMRFIHYLFHKENGFHPTYPENIAYSLLLEQLNMKTLQERRNNQGVLFIFKLLKNLIDSPELLSKINIRVPDIKLRINENKKILSIPKNRLTTPLEIAMSNFNNMYNNLDISMNIGEIIKRLKCNI